jgi:hypothetical protein
MRPVIDLGDLWGDAVRQATQQVDIRKRDMAREQAASQAARACPFTPNDLCSREYDVQSLLEKLAATAQS